MFRFLKTYGYVALVSVLAMSVISCGDTGRSKKTVINIEGVYMNTRNFYTVLVKGDGGAITPTDVNLSYFYAGKGHRVRFLKDVDADSSMYVIVTYSEVCDIETQWVVSDIEFHIRHTSDVQGGAWDNGKFGRGHVSPIAVEDK